MWLWFDLGGPESLKLPLLTLTEHTDMALDVSVSFCPFLSLTNRCEEVNASKGECRQINNTLNEYIIYRGGERTLRKKLHVFIEHFH